MDILYMFQKWWFLPSFHGSFMMEPAGEDSRWQEGSVFGGFLVINADSLVSSVFLSLPSIDPPEGGEWRPEQQDSEDHWFWPGSGMAPNHQDERSRDICVDGTRSHSCLHVFQGQWRVEVRAIGTASVFPRSVLAAHILQDLENWSCIDSQAPQLGISDPFRAIYSNSHVARGQFLIPSSTSNSSSAVAGTTSMQTPLCWWFFLGKISRCQGQCVLRLQGGEGSQSLLQTFLRVTLACFATVAVAAGLVLIVSSWANKYSLCSFFLVGWKVSFPVTS